MFLFLSLSPPRLPLSLKSMETCPWVRINKIKNFKIQMIRCGEMTGKVNKMKNLITITSAFYVTSLPVSLNQCQPLFPSSASTDALIGPWISESPLDLQVALPLNVVPIKAHIFTCKDANNYWKQASSKQHPDSSPGCYTYSSSSLGSRMTAEPSSLKTLWEWRARSSARAGKLMKNLQLEILIGWIKKPTFEHWWNRLTFKTHELLSLLGKFGFEPL